MSIQKSQPAATASDQASPRPNRNLNLYLLGGIIFLALLLRTGLVLVTVGHLQRAFLPDTQTYLDPAMKLLATAIYPPDSAWRTPLYPMFIALIYWIAGAHPIYVIAAQILVSTASVALTYLLGVQLLPRPAAVIAALFMAVSIESITYAVYLTTETLFTFLLLGSLLSLMKARDMARRGWVAIAAILMSLAVLCRPIAISFPLVVLLLLILDRCKRWAVRIKDGIIYFLVFAAVLSPWVYRNKVLFGLPTVTTISDYYFLFYNAAAVEANLGGVSVEDIRPILEQRVVQTLADLGEQGSAADLAHVQDRLAWQIIKTHPLLFLYLHLKSDLNNFLPDVTGLSEILGLTVGGKGTLSILNQFGLLAAVRHYFGDALWVLWIMLPVIILLGIVYLFDLAGVLSLAREKHWYVLLILILPAIYFLLSPGESSLPRFRVPVMPYLCLLAGLGFHSIWLSLKRRGIKNKP